MKIKFLAVLKKVVHPEHYLLSKLFPLVQAEASGLGDLDLETVRSWISIDYYTAYEAVPNRKQLGFSIEIPDWGEALAEHEEPYWELTRKLIDTPSQSLNDNESCFIRELQSDSEMVESILRYEDDFILEDFRRYQPEIFSIEMRLREVLNYILAYNLKNNPMDEFLKEFEGAELANKQMNKNKELQRKRYREYYENELFHVVFTKYSVIRGEKQKKPKGDEILQKIQTANSFEELKQALYNITFSDLNPAHATFLNDIKSHLLPIETMRNDIMHTRKPSVDNEQKYEQAKIALLGLIESFWEAERIHLPNAERIKEYLLEVIFNDDNFELLEDDTVRFVDLNFQEQEMWVEEFKPAIIEQVGELLSVNYGYDLSEKLEEQFYANLDERIEELKTGEPEIDSNASEAN